MIRELIFFKDTSKVVIQELYVIWNLFIFSWSISFA